jgi:site-specific recombinase XerC
VLKINRELNSERLSKYRELLNSVGISELQPQWKAGITDFLEWLIRERTLATTYGYAVRVFEFAEYTRGDFLSPTDEELKSYIGSKKAKGVSATNISITVTALTKFYTWLPVKNPKCLENIKDEYIKGTRSKREEIITEDELDRLIQVSDYPRDKALWSLLYDSGCRIGELQTLRVKDIEMNDYGHTMKVNGKTGQRWVVVVGNSIVYLQEWLKVHQTNKDRDAYVFC